MLCTILQLEINREGRGVETVGFQSVRRPWLGLCHACRCNSVGNPLHGLVARVRVEGFDNPPRSVTLLHAN